MQSGLKPPAYAIPNHFNPVNNPTAIERAPALGWNEVHFGDDPKPDSQHDDISMSSYKHKTDLYFLWASIGL